MSLRLYVQIIFPNLNANGLFYTLMLSHVCFQTDDGPLGRDKKLLQREKTRSTEDEEFHPEGPENHQRKFSRGRNNTKIFSPIKIFEHTRTSGIKKENNIQGATPVPAVRGPDGDLLLRGGGRGVHPRDQVHRRVVGGPEREPRGDQTAELR